ncbi:DUF1542 domain-containing protein, partial [Fructobacillus ficulneus]
ADQLSERLNALQTAVTATNTTVQATDNWSDTVKALNTFVNTTVPAITLQADKEDAVNQLKKTLADTQADIAADTSLTTDQIKSQTQDATDAYNAAEKAVDGVSTDADVATQLKTGTGNITGTHKPQTPIQGEGGRVDQFKGNITNESEKVRDQVATNLNNKAITADQAQTLNAAIDQAVATAQTAAGNAKNADDINTAQANLETALTAVQTNLAKNVSDNKIDAAQTAALNTIDQDGTLSGQEKASQTAAVNDAASKGKDAVDGTKTADEATTAGKDAVDKIDGIHQHGQPVSDRLPDFEDKIRTAAQGLIDQAKANTNLSQTGLATITAAVNGMRDRLITELKTVTTVVDAETMVSDDQNAFALGQGTGSDVSQAKSQWVNRLYST